MGFPRTSFSAALLVLLLACAVVGSQPQYLTSQHSELDDAFRGAVVVNLATSRSPSVVTLRNVVKIPPPTTPVVVKIFRRDALPEVLRPVFADPRIRGVTISGCYIAILQTEFSKEYHDILQHELVHAYITLASPRPLPFWLQEGSAVHFSIDKGRKFYGKPAKDRVGVTIGKTVDLPDVYKNKLQNFHYLIEKVGKAKFYRWYRQAVVTGVVNPRPLLGLTPRPKPLTYRKAIPIWAIVAAGVVIIGVSVAGYYAFRREPDVW